jgi:hypothetical protein
MKPAAAGPGHHANKKLKKGPIDVQKKAKMYSNRTSHFTMGFPRGTGEQMLDSKLRF